MREFSLLEKDIETYLTEHENKDLLRFITCGSVDDGKSTLIGRLLHDSKTIFEDQLQAVARDSLKSGTTGDAPDLALLVDGLQSEREQGITIDVAYRYFTTDKRKFIIADTPGHEQYTRNMATGASTADLAIILIDARHGVQVQTRRHSFIVSLLGIRNIVVAINKMDLVRFSRERYEEIVAQYRKFAAQLSPAQITFVPISALNGDNVVEKSCHTGWYTGKALLQHLEEVEISPVDEKDPFRLPVQYVNRPDSSFRGFAGTIASGTIRVGEAVTVLPSRKTSTIASIVTYDGLLDEATAPMAVTITLADEIDISRGNLLVAGEQPLVADSLKVQLVWMHESPLETGRSYLIKRGSSVTSGVFGPLYFRQDVNTLEKVPTSQLELNEIGQARLTIASPLAFDPYERNRFTGSFIVIDRLSNNTLGAGMILDSAEDDGPRYSAFELEFNALVRRYYPHWNAKDVLAGNEDYTI